MNPTTPAEVLRQARDALAYYATAGKAGELCSGDIATDALAAIDALPSAPATDIDEAQLARLHERGAAAWAGVDAQALREGAPSGEPAPTRADLIAALQFYANGDHMHLSDESAWDTVSGEPQNWWCDEAGTATIEDGSLAKMALAGDMNAGHFAALERGADVCIQPEAGTAPTAPAPLSADAEELMRTRFGSVRGHPEWRALAEAFNAGKAAAPLMANGPAPRDLNWQMLADMEAGSDGLAARREKRRAEWGLTEAETSATASVAGLASPAAAAPEPVASEYLFIQMDDDKRAWHRWCADAAEVREAVKAAMFILPAGEELSAEHAEQLDGSVEELMDSGALTFEGDPPLYLYRMALAAWTKAPAAHPVPAVAATVQALTDALRMIAWSNDSAWQAQCAREALEAHGIATPAAPKGQQ